MRKGRRSFGKKLTESKPRSDTSRWSLARLEAARVEQDVRNAFVMGQVRERLALEARLMNQPAVDLFTPRISVKVAGFASRDPYYIRAGGFLVDPTTGEIEERSRIEQNAKNYREASQPCAAAKESRRAAVLNSGYGGINGARSYKPHTECK